MGDLRGWREECGLGGLNWWGICGENAIAGGSFRTLGPFIGACEVFNCVLLGIESVEVDAKGSELSTAESGVDIGRRMGFDDRVVGEFEGFFNGMVVLGEEPTGVGDVSFGPSDLVHLGEVFYEVGVGVELLLDLAKVDDDGSREGGPLTLDDFVGDEG